MQKSIIFFCNLLYNIGILEVVNMLKLFISTYNELIQIGLFKDNDLFDKSEFETYKSHSKFIVPMIKEILERNKLNVSNLNEIIVVNGPGSFTGTRLGVTDAKMLAYTLNIPIKTITSIEAIALSVPEKDKIICISDNKGKYIGEFKDNKLIKDIYYIKNDLAEELFTNTKDKVYIDQKIDLDKISNQLSTLNPVNVHLANPIYIKTIEALSDK